MKVIHVITSLKRGGRERQLSTIVKHADQLRNSSKIIYFNEHFPNYIAEYGLSDRVLRIVSKSFLSRLLELHRTIKKEKPDIVYTWGNLESIFTLLLNPFHKFIFINGSLRHGIRSKVFWHYFRTFILQISKNIVANSHAGLKVEKLRRGFVLYNGIANKFNGMISKEKKKDKRKKMFNVAEKVVFFISVANMSPYKDYYSVLEALRLIKDNGINFYYLILGDGPLRKILEQRIIENELSANINILGNIQNVHEYLEMADIFIHSSKGEGCSNAILEAMFAGLPVIATNVGGTPEIAYEKSFRLFEYQDTQSLTRILLNIDKEFCDFNPNSPDYKEHLSKFTIDTMMNKYENILNEIVSHEHK